MHWCPFVWNVTHRPAPALALHGRRPKKQKNNAENNMHGLLKALSYVVALLVLVAIFYAGYTAVKYWAGIGV